MYTAYYPLRYERYEAQRGAERPPPVVIPVSLLAENLITLGYSRFTVGLVLSSWVISRFTVG